MALEAHLKRLKVSRFKGSKRILIIGLTIVLDKDRPIPASRRLTRPFSKEIPEMRFETR